MGKAKERREVSEGDDTVTIEDTSDEEDGETLPVSYGPPWAHCLGGYQDRLLGGPLGLPDLRCTAPDGVKHKDCRGEVLD
jgi:hypothetical protein